MPGKHRAAEIVSLCLVTSMSLKESQLFPRFHPLGDDPKLEAPAHADHSVHDGGIVRSGCNLPDKRLVDLQRINRELSEIAQARITGAEIIHGNLYSTGSECFQDRGGRFGALHQNAFRQLQLQQVWIKAGLAEGCEHALQKIVVSELHRGDIHRHRAEWQAGSVQRYEPACTLHEGPNGRSAE